MMAPGGATGLCFAWGKRSSYSWAHFDADARGRAKKAADYSLPDRAPPAEARTMAAAHLVALLLLLSITEASASGCNASLPFCDPTVPTEARIKDFLGRATTLEKAGLLFGKSIDRLGVPKLTTGEALHGVAQGCEKDSTGREFCPSSFPCALNLGASLNESLWKLVGETIGTESRAVQPGGGARFTPDINLFRDPRWYAAAAAIATGCCDLLHACTFKTLPRLGASSGCCCAFSLCLSAWWCHSAARGMHHRWLLPAWLRTGAVGRKFRARIRISPRATLRILSAACRRRERKKLTAVFGFHPKPPIVLPRQALDERKEIDGCFRDRRGRRTQST
jgi:hypothetical protein